MEISNLSVQQFCQLTYQTVIYGLANTYAGVVSSITLNWNNFHHWKFRYFSHQILTQVLGQQTHRKLWIGSLYHNPRVEL